MADETQKLALPFLTREMLDFEHSTSFQLVARIQAGTTLPVFIRGATKQGPFTLRLAAATGNYAVTTSTFNIPDVPIWVTVTDDAGNISEGDAFVRLSLALNGDRLYHLASGYIDSLNAISWPNALTQRNVNLGELVVLTSANPAAGAELTYTVPANTLLKIRNIQFTLVTDGNAANRTVRLIFTTVAALTTEVVSNTVQTATQTIIYSCYPTTPGGGGGASTASIILPLPPDLILDSGGTITTITTNKQATDDYGAMKILAEQFIRAA